MTKWKWRYTMFPTRIDADPLPTARLRKQWADLDQYSQADYGKPYDSLNRTEAIQLHVNIKEGKYKELNAKSATKQQPAIV